MDIESLIREVLNAVYAVKGALSSGFVESVYRNALVIELRERGIRAAVEVPIRVEYKGYTVGEFRADVLVEDNLLLELKAVEQLAPVHEVQLVNYLNATGIDNGLLINFGNGNEIKRKYRVYKNSRQKDVKT